MRKKTVRAFLGILALVILVFHLLWFYNYSMYHNYTDGLNEMQKFLTYSILEGNDVYHVKFPSYPSFTGNLSVSTYENDISLIIWPSRFVETEYGAKITLEDGSYLGIMINKNLEAFDSMWQQTIDENRDAISALFQRATARWNDF